MTKKELEDKLELQAKEIKEVMEANQRIAEEGVEKGNKLRAMEKKYNQLYAEAVKLKDNRDIQFTQLMIQASERTEKGSELKHAYNQAIAVRLGVMKLDESQMKVSK